MEQATRLDLPLLLPDVADEGDRCVERLVRLLERRDGIARVHVVRAGETPPGEPGAAPAAEPQLCLHYDPERVTLGRVREIARLAGADVSDRFAHILVPFRALGSEDDGKRLEAGLRELRGVSGASVNFAGQVARVEYDRRAASLADVHARLRDLGAEPGVELLGPSVARAPRDAVAAPERATAAGAPAAHGAGEAAHREGDGHDHAKEPAADAGWYVRNRELAWSLLSGVFLLAGWLLHRQGVSPLAWGAAYAAAYFFGARDNVGHFLKDLRRGKFRFNIDLLMVVAALGAAILGEYAEGALLLFLFSLGHALEHYALGRARNAIKALAELAPQVAIVKRADGREEKLPIESVKPGDLVVVLPAERVPVDGEVAEGKSGVNQAPITGESVPVDKAPGDEVFAGSVNGEGALVVKVTAAIGDRTLDRVVRLVAEAETQKAPTQQFTERFEKWFVPAVLVADALLIAVPPLLGVWTLHESFYRAMAMLVAASPCALALGTPAAVLAGIARAAKKGVLIKGGAHLETLGTIEVLALDKTGTITKGEPAVTDVVPAEGVTEERLLAVAAAVERRSQHPLAKAVVRAAEERKLQVSEAGDLQSVTARGVRSVVEGRAVEIGRALMFEEAKLEVPADLRATVARLEREGRSTMIVRRAPADGAAGETGGGWLGVLGLADEPRADVKKTLDRLRAVGMKRIVMLTGDNKGVGEAVGRAVGVDEVRAGLLPEDKVTAIKEYAAQGRVAMVGDGVNDAPALAHATVGIAMGGMGTAAALETADVALMGDDLGRLPFAVGLSRQSRNVIRQNLYVSLGVIALLVVATVTGATGIAIAVVVHEGSTLVVIANALRLLGYGDGD